MKKFPLLLSILFLALVFVMVPLMSACRAPEPGVNLLKIGMITSATGPMAPAFKGMLDAAKPTQDLLNQRGGVTVKGEKYDVEIVVEDDKSSPDGAVAAATTLMGKGIRFVIAPIFLPANMAIASMCEEAKIMRVTPICINPAIVAGPEGGRYCFYSSTTIYNVPRIYDYVLKTYPGVKKVGILILDDPGVMIGREKAREEIKRRGLQLVFDEVYPIPTSDFYPILTKVLEKKPDVIDGVVSIPPFGAGIINQSRELGFTGPLFWTCGTGDINALNAMLKPEYAYDIINGLPNVLSDDMPPLVKQLRKLVEETGAPFIYDCIHTLDCAYIVVEGVKKAQSLDVDRVVAALEGMETIDTIWGKAGWGGKDLGVLNHLVMSPYPFSRIMGGKAESLIVKP